MMLDNLNLDCTQDPHNIKNYFESTYQCRKHTIMNSWKDYILINALNNSLRNAQSKDFYPLSEDLNNLPDKVAFVSSAEEEKILSYLYGNYQRIEYPHFAIHHKDNTPLLNAELEKIRI